MIGAVEAMRRGMRGRGREAGIVWLAAIAAIVACANRTRAQDDLPISAEVVAEGLVAPLFVTHAPGDFDRLFILERTTPNDIGRVRIYDLASETLLEEPFLEIPVDPFGEGGLLGLAFHPDYEENGYLYVNYTDHGGGKAGHTRVERYTRSADDPDRADPESDRLVLRFDQPDIYHNAGWIGFGPEGLLYVSSGDGGASNGTSQDTHDVLGSMLRVDVDGDDFPDDNRRNYAIPPDNPFVGVGGAPEIWAYGLRNPWRNSFDRETGDLYIGDVGEHQWEEVNYQAAGEGAGANYGWPCERGPDDDTCDADTVSPIHAFTHAEARAITGGYVYRGCAVPELRGRYFFAGLAPPPGPDRVWSFRLENGEVKDLREHTDLFDMEGSLLSSAVSFGEDAYGELYITDFSDGEIYKIVREGPPANDCNDNGIEDTCEIRDGSLSDANGNGVPDVCEGPCEPDLTGDGVLNEKDLSAYIDLFADGDPQADLTGPDGEPDGQITSADFLEYLDLFAAGCH